MSIRDRIFGIGMSRRFQRHLDELHLPSGPGDQGPVTEADIAHLPEPARRYLTFMRVVGRPRNRSFRARLMGRFRQRPGQGWMRRDARQYNSNVVITRVLHMRLDFAGVVPMFYVVFALYFRSPTVRTELDDNDAP